MLSALARNIEPPATIELPNKASMLRKAGHRRYRLQHRRAGFHHAENIRNKPKMLWTRRHAYIAKGQLELGEALWEAETSTALAISSRRFARQRRQAADGGYDFALCEAGTKLVLPTPCWSAMRNDQDVRGESR
jgi:hypothetical protein